MKKSLKMIEISKRRVWKPTIVLTTIISFLTYPVNVILPRNVLFDNRRFSSTNSNRVISKKPSMSRRILKRQIAYLTREYLKLSKEYLCYVRAEIERRKERPILVKVRDPKVMTLKMQLDDFAFTIEVLNDQLPSNERKKLIKPENSQFLDELYALPSFINKEVISNKKIKRLEKTEATTDLRKKALILLKRSRFYGTLFEDINEFSVLTQLQNQVLDQYIFEIKPPIELNETIKKASFYALFKRMLRFIRANKTLHQIRKQIPKDFQLGFFAINKEDQNNYFSEDELLEGFILPSLVAVLNAFRETDKRSYLDICLLVGKNLLLNIQPYRLLKDLSKATKKISQFALQKDSDRILKDYSKKVGHKTSTELEYRLGNVFVISFIKIGLLRVIYPDEIANEYRKLEWYNVLQGRDLKDYMKEQGIPRPGLFLALHRLNEINEMKDILPDDYMSLAYSVPSRVRPIPYYLDFETNEVSFGGFISNEILCKYTLIKPEFQESKLKILEQRFLDAVNIMQNQPFSISSEVLIYLRNCYHKGTLFASKDVKAKQRQILSLIEAAEILIKGKPNIFYNPVKLDFRSRSYPLSYPLNYQGPELLRMMFQTVEPYRLTRQTATFLLRLFSLYSNKIFKNKTPEQQLQYFNDNMTRIKELPESYNLNTLTLYKKYDYIKLAIELHKLNFFDHPNPSVSSLIDKESHLLISIDAKSSGLQIISLLMNSTTLAKKLNIIRDEDNEQAEDIYIYIADKIHHFISLNLDDFLERYPRFLFFNDSNERLYLDRSCWKRIIMIRGYAAGVNKLYSTFKLTLMSFDHIKPILLCTNDAIIKHYFFRLLGEVRRLLPELSKFVRLTLLISELAFEESIEPLQWKNLNGSLEITQIYNKITTTRYVSSYDNIVHKVNVNKILIDKKHRKTVWGFVANLVQSLDANILHEIVRISKEQYNISIYGSAHDCILIRLCDYDIMQDIISQVIRNLFTYENITKFWLQFHKYIPENNLPKFEKLTKIDKDSFEKLIDEVCKTKNLFVLA